MREVRDDVTREVRDAVVDDERALDVAEREAE
jgi:hypothetical protein